MYNYWNECSTMKSFVEVVEINERPLHGWLVNTAVSPHFLLLRTIHYYADHILVRILGLSAKLGEF